MPIEYICLVIMTLFYLFAWLPVSLGKMKSFGRNWVFSNREPLKNSELVPWAARCDRAYNNLKDYFPAFVVAIVLLGILRKFDHSTNLAAIIFVIGRLGHYISYGAGIVPLRAAFFIPALLSNAYLLIKVLI
jgi:uncharacterized MAPEG superfamily protein